MRDSWPNFPRRELECSCCGQLDPTEPAAFEKLMDDVQAFRNLIGKPVPLVSAYRCPKHPIERRKLTPGWHNKAGVDLGLSHADGILALTFFLNKGYTGVGVNQKGSGRFIHIDRRTDYSLWSY